MFDVGDIVKVKENADQIHRPDPLTFAWSMKKLLGKESIILKVSSTGRYIIQDSDCFWAEQWLEPVETSCEINIEEDMIDTLLRDK